MVDIAWIKEVCDFCDLSDNSETTSGIDYWLNQEQYLRYFLEDGTVPLDNNSAKGKMGVFL